MSKMQFPRGGKTLLLVLLGVIVAQSSLAQVYWVEATHFAPPWTGYNPDFADLDGDGDLDLVYAVVTQSYRNVGSPTVPSWLRDDSLVSGVNYEQCMTACFADLDADGDLDLSVGRLNGELHALLYYENVGSAAQPVWRWDLTMNMYGSLPPGYVTCPELADLDGDGDFDLILATTHNFFGYRNTGTPEVAAWSEDGSLVEGLPSPSPTGDPCCGDLDGDGDLDLVIGGRWAEGPTRSFENTGTSQSPIWVRNDNLLTGVERDVVGYGLDVADIDGDGDPDILSCEEVAGSVLYLNQGPSTPVDQSSWGRIKALFRQR